MASDRASSLIVEAAGRGAIDFRDADILDRKWWLKVGLITDYLERQHYARIFEVKISQHTALLDYKSETETLDHHWKAIGKLRDKLISELMPWQDVGPEDTRELAAQLEQDYEAEFGDPTTPEYQAQIDKLLEHWRENRKEAE